MLAYLARGQKRDDDVDGEVVDGRVEDVDGRVVLGKWGKEGSKNEQEKEK